MGLDVVEFVIDVEDHFGILLRDDDMERIRTIGDLADVILARIRTFSVTGCPSVHAFYQLRAAIRESLGEPGLRIRPSSRLVDVIPVPRRRACWTAIQAKQPWRFPKLQMSRSIYSLMVTFVAIVWVVPSCFLPMEMWTISGPLSFLVAIFVCSWMNRYRFEVPPDYSTMGDLVRSSVGTVIAAKKNELTTKVLVLGDLFPIVAEQFGVELKKLTAQTRFVEDLGAG